MMMKLKNYSNVLKTLENIPYTNGKFSSLTVLASLLKSDIEGEYKNVWDWYNYSKRQCICFLFHSLILYHMVFQL